MSFTVAQSGNCGKGPMAHAPTLELPVLPAAHGVRPSRMGRRRAIVLGLVHVLILAHIAHWLIAGKTLSPVEPSEAMYTLDNGYVNAGFIFFAASILATLIFGRFFCGWGCHLVAYQDLCGWMLKKVGIRPRPFRSRLLILAPLALALYMFVWPTAYRLIAGYPAPKLENHLLTSEFWETFPGPWVAVLTFAVCGFIIVYFLGNKGFCTYACPYGGFFGVADRFARGRIRVTDDCEGCGHCTAVCSSNVRVHEEVARFGMVVNPGCMKCMDCVSVCPKDALYFGFAERAGSKENVETSKRRSIEIDPSRARKEAVPYDFTLAEELIMALIGLGALLAYRGLYGQIPLLLAMGMAAITTFLVIKSVRLLRSPHVRLQNFQLKVGGRMRPAGLALLGFVAAVVLFAGHSAAVQHQSWRGRTLFRDMNMGDEVWLPGNGWWQGATVEQRAQVDTATLHLGRVQRWGLLDTPSALLDLVWLYLAKNDVAEAEAAVRRLIVLMPEDANVHRGLAGVLRKAGRLEEAEAAYREAIRLDAQFERVRLELAAMLTQLGRVEDAIAEYRAGLKSTDKESKLAIEAARTLAASDRVAEAVAELRTYVQNHAGHAAAWAELGVLQLRGGDAAGLESLRVALQIEPSMTEARYNLAMGLLALVDRPSAGQGAPVNTGEALSEAVAHLTQVIREQPEFAEAHYNLGVAKFMSGRVDQAIPHVRESLRLMPGDAQAEAFLRMLQSAGPSPP